MSFPQTRMRRLRKSEALRSLVQETRLHPADFVYPLFVSETATKAEPIDAMPGVFRFPVSEVAREAERVYKLGVPAVLLFGIPARKDASGSSSLKSDGVVQQAVRAIKDKNDRVAIITDVCLCEYTDHGHCGILKQDTVDNDTTLELLARQAVSHAKAGADMVAPSDMMDGRVAAIRKALDADGFQDTPIMAYSAKFCSAFYGPFREAADSAPQSGDRRGYQMDPANGREAVRETLLDIDEGADIVMVKPALPYLDIIAKVRAACNMPLAAYNVSGEYSMVKLQAAQGLAEERRLALEVLTSIKRAGADIIITYHAADAARWLAE
ncbi:MAG: porphobilinogen synthase [candidate division Zixibacteria bacterium]|nr:porphobilinogen synthase [candidate division Zixibacteria bacterium]